MFTLNTTRFASRTGMARVFSLVAALITLTVALGMVVSTPAQAATAPAPTFGTHFHGVWSD